MGALGVALGGAALGFWWLFKDPPKHYYFAVVTNADGIPLYLVPPQGIVPLTGSQATEWRLDLMESAWGSDVSLYRWQNGAWART
jgi:hypothetical protein